MMIAVVITARKDRPKGVEEKSQPQHERCGSVEEMRALRFRQRHHGLKMERDGFVQGMEYVLEGFPLNGNIQIQAYRLPLATAAFSVTPENLAHSSLSWSNSGINRYPGGAIPIKSVAQSELRSNRNRPQERVVNRPNQRYLLSGFESVEAAQVYRHYSAHFEALTFA